jgi:hypothetical protein
LLLALRLADDVRANGFHVFRLQVLREREHPVLDQRTARHDRRGGQRGVPKPVDPGELTAIIASVAVRPSQVTLF